MTTFHTYSEPTPCREALLACAREARSSLITVQMVFEDFDQLTLVVRHQPIGQYMSSRAGRVLRMVFNPKGDVLATLGENAITLWDTTTRLSLAEIAIPIYGADLYERRAVLNLAYEPEGETLYYSELSVSFTADGQAGGDSMLRIGAWDMNVASWQKRACRLANRNLTREEWQTYLGDLLYRKTCPDLP